MVFDKTPWRPLSSIKMDWWKEDPSLGIFPLPLLLAPLLHQEQVCFLGPVLTWGVKKSTRYPTVPLLFHVLKHLCLFHVLGFPLQKEKKNVNNPLYWTMYREVVHFEWLRRGMNSKTNRRRSHWKIISMEKFQTTKSYEKNLKAYFMAGGEQYC